LHLNLFCFRGAPSFWSSKTFKTRPSTSRCGVQFPDFAIWTGLPDFHWSKQTKTVKIYQMTTTYTKRQ
jgi:hypothetical protein